VQDMRNWTNWMEAEVRVERRGGGGNWQGGGNGNGSREWIKWHGDSSIQFRLLAVHKLQLTQPQTQLRITKRIY